MYWLPIGFVILLLCCLGLAAAAMFANALDLEANAEIDFDAQED